MALKYSRQREAIWQFLRDRTDHPTADAVYTGVRMTCPGISLGTVYRNLMLMQDLGKIRTVSVGDGTVHFDPNLAPHDHFVCSVCGKIFDMPPADLSSLRESLRESAESGNLPGHIEGYTACFHGVCNGCTDRNSSRT